MLPCCVTNDGGDALSFKSSCFGQASNMSVMVYKSFLSTLIIRSQDIRRLARGTLDSQTVEELWTIGVSFVWAPANPCSSYKPSLQISKFAKNGFTISTPMEDTARLSHLRVAPVAPSRSLGPETKVP